MRDRDDLLNLLDDWIEDGGERAGHAKNIKRLVRDQVILTNILNAWVEDIEKHVQ